jgi:glucosamine-6-phosphate deaminase
MRIIIHQNADQFNKAASLLIAGLLQLKPAAVLGLATGSTPVGMYRELATLYQQNLVSFHESTTFNLDEYVGMPKQHPQSYFHYMSQHLFNHVDLRQENIHIPNGEASDLKAECERYDRLLNKEGQIDLQILGMGHNGHIGFNEPNDVLISGTHVVSLHENTRQANARFFTSVDHVPTQAITMGISPIMQAKSILLLVRGKDKAAIVSRALTAPISTECPASFLQTHPSLIVMLDSEAGRELNANKPTYSHS